MAPHNCACASCGKRPAAFLLDARLERADDLFPVAGLEIGVERVAVAVLVLVEDLLEVMMRNTEHHVGIHGDEAPVAVVGEAPVAGLFRERRHRDVVEPEIEHSVHHARHRGARARAHGHEQRIIAIAEIFAGDAADLSERRFDLRLQILRIGFVVLVEIGADLGGDGETGRHRQAEMRHLGKARALATEEIAHFGAAFGLAAAEAINPLAFFGGSLRGGLYDRLGCGLYDGLGGDFARRGNRLGRPRRTRLRSACAARRGLAGFLHRLTGHF